MSRANTVWRSVSMYIGATMFFVALDSLAKVMVTTMPLPVVVWGRYAGSLCLLLCILPFIGVRATLSSKHIPLHVARGALLMGATACMFKAVGLLPVAESYAISYVSPLIVIVLAALLLAERVTTLQAVGVCLGFIGVLIIIRPGFHAWRWAMLLPLGTALLYALYQILTRMVGQHDSAMTSLLYVTLAGTLLTSVTLPWTYTAVPLSSWLVIGIMGTLGTIGHFLLIKAYQLGTASFLSPFVYIQIIWAGLIDYFIFNTSLDPPVLVGALVLIGAGLVILKGTQTLKFANKEIEE